MPGVKSIEIDAYVVAFQPLGFDFILGMNGIEGLGGVTIKSSSLVRFGGEGVQGQVGYSAGAAVKRDAMKVVQRDFEVSFDPNSRVWTTKWKWLGDNEPVGLKNRIARYPMADSVREPFDEEILRWIREGWLRRYDEKHQGPAKGLVPLLAVVQASKGKVRPVLDFRELNAFIDNFTADADVCASKLREWRRMGMNTSVIDLSTAYMQIRVDEQLWPFQTIVFRGERFCLTRLGFGLNVAPLILKSVLNAVLALDDMIRRATCPYVDDMLVNEDIAPVEKVITHLSAFGLVCKPAEKLSAGTRALGLKVEKSDNELRWQRGNALPEVPHIITRRAVFSFCGKMTGHLPVCGWLRPATAFLKRRVNSLSSSWDERILDEGLLQMMQELVQRVREKDPAAGRWNVDGGEATVWADASSLALGVVVMVGSQAVEDACWLRSDDSSHINMAELDALTKGLNMAIAWDMRTVHLKTDSLTVYRWVSDALSGKCRLKTKASGEMLIRRRVGIIKDLVVEYGLQVDVSFVPSAANVADVLTRVPRRWLSLAVGAGGAMAVCDVADGAVKEEQIRRIHENTGHQGVDRTMYFLRRAKIEVPRDCVSGVIARCQPCQSIDPAPVRWEKGDLKVGEVWQRLGMDVTHYRGEHFLTLIDCGPSRFAVWRQLRRQDSVSVVEALEEIFFERGAPAELLTDNDPAFSSEIFRSCARRWGMSIRYRCAYVPSGNGIAERAHRTVKRIAARLQCSISEAVYWYNVSPKDPQLSSESSVPADRVYAYAMRVRGVDVEPEEAAPIQGLYSEGDEVWIKPANSRCDKQYRLGVVTRLVSKSAVEVDGITRHVRDLRPVVMSAERQGEWSGRKYEPMPLPGDPCGQQEDDDQLLELGRSENVGEESGSSSGSAEETEVARQTPVGRPARVRRPPAWFGDYVVDF